MRYTVRVELAVALDLDLDIEAEDEKQAAELASNATFDAAPLRTITERLRQFSAECTRGDVVVSDIRVAPAGGD